MFTTNTATDLPMPRCYYGFYTPKKIIRSAFEVMGQIDLDPCSNSHANPNVPATTLYTIEDDGLSQDWRGKVFLNPPYGIVILDWLEKLQYHFQRREVTEAICLLPASTNTWWFTNYSQYTLCFVRRRLFFLRPSGNYTEANNGSVVIYLGRNKEQFTQVYRHLGTLCERMEPYDGY